MMGWHIETCPEGDFERTFYHSCRHRVCLNALTCRSSNGL
jgi:hypothetical protein